jgi:hypothetical protein
MQHRQPRRAVAVAVADSGNNGTQLARGLLAPAGRAQREAAQHPNAGMQGAQQRRDDRVVRALQQDVVKLILGAQQRPHVPVAGHPLNIGDGDRDPVLLLVGRPRSKALGRQAF